MPLKDFPGPEEWSVDLDQRWPERVVLRDELVETVFLRAMASPAQQPGVAELGLGAGEVLRRLAAELPSARLIGIDSEPAVIEHVGAALGDAADAPRRRAVALLQADLNDGSWPTLAGAPFDVVYSMQTFHDLGGWDALEKIYRRVLDALRPGGVLINVDFVVPLPGSSPQRRFEAAEHRRLLESLGFHDIQVERRLGELAFIVARRAGSVG